MLPIIRASVTLPSRAQRPVRRTAIFSHRAIYRGKRSATMASARQLGGIEGGKNRLIAAGLPDRVLRADKTHILGMLGMAALLAHKHAPRREAGPSRSV